MATDEPAGDNTSGDASARTKFAPDGSARHFPGNTIISAVVPESAETRCLTRAVDLLRDAFASDFVLLPPTSWHMTVFELVCDRVRDADHWSRFLDTTAPLSTTDEFFAARVPTVAAPEHIIMRYSAVTIGDNAAGLLLDPDDAATASALERYRDELSDSTGVRFPDHDSYRFHITLAYKLRVPNADTQQQIDVAVAQVQRELTDTRFRLERPMLTYFRDMTEFAVDARPAEPG